LEITLDFGIHLVRVFRVVLS